jgi:hypothetical protein
MHIFQIVLLLSCVLINDYFHPLHVKMGNSLYLANFVTYSPRCKTLKIKAVDFDYVYFVICKLNSLINRF